MIMYLAAVMTAFRALYPDLYFQTLVFNLDLLLPPIVTLSDLHFQFVIPLHTSFLQSCFALRPQYNTGAGNEW